MAVFCLSFPPPVLLCACRVSGSTTLACQPLWVSCLPHWQLPPSDWVGAPLPDGRVISSTKSIWKGKKLNKQCGRIGESASRKAIKTSIRLQHYPLLQKGVEMKAYLERTFWQRQAGEPLCHLCSWAQETPPSLPFRRGPEKEPQGGPKMMPFGNWLIWRGGLFVQRSKSLPKSEIFSVLSPRLFPVASISNTTPLEAGANLKSLGRLFRSVSHLPWLASFNSNPQVLFCVILSCLCVQSLQKDNKESWNGSSD